MQPSKQWNIVPLTEAYGRQLCEWRYPAPYDVYNWPSWEEMAQNGEEFADPQIREAQYGAVVDSQEDGKAALCGFVQFFPLAGVTRLGFGLRPDLCGQGFGEAFVRAISAEALRRCLSNEIDLEVLVWNKRAIRTYQKAGFQIEDTYERMGKDGNMLVHCMVYERVTDHNGHR